MYPMHNRTSKWYLSFLVTLAVVLATANLPPILFFTPHRGELQGKWALVMASTGTANHGAIHLDLQREYAELYGSADEMIGSNIGLGSFRPTQGTVKLRGDWQVRGDTPFQEITLFFPDNHISIKLLCCIYSLSPALYMVNDMPNHYYFVKVDNYPHSYLLHIIISILIIAAGALTIMRYFAIHIFTGVRILSYKHLNICDFICMLIMLLNLFALALFWLSPSVLISAR